jgi:3'-5' exoribonuclease
MPKTRFVKDIKEGEQVRDLFLVGGKTLLTSNAGKPYLSLQLRDRTGLIEGRVWDRAEEIGKRFERDDVVEASGTAIAYQGRIQLKVHDVRPGEKGPRDLSEFLPVTRKGIDPLWKTFQGYVAEVRDPELKRLLTAVFPDPPETDVARRFRQAPGGKTMHHDYIGGLLEHTVSVAGICRVLSSHYEGVNGDLLLAGAMLHDIGKVHELSYEGAFDYTDEGRLLGHLYMGAEYADSAPM